MLGITSVSFGPEDGDTARWTCTLVVARHMPVT